MIGEPHDQGLVFKWGSLVGIEMPSLAADGTLFRGAADVVFRPAGFTGTITDDWTTVPWCNTDFGNYGNPAIDHLATVNDPTAGIGDICRYMGVIDGANWRMPTAAEQTELYGSDQNDKGKSVKLGNGWVVGNYYPLSGLAMGPNRNDVAITGDGVNARVTSAEPWINGTVFLQASGHRNDRNGAIYNIGSYGFYWSSTASAEDRGYDIQFNSSNVWPQNSDLRTYGLSIRCIRE